MNFLESSENDITLLESEVPSDELEDILQGIGFEFCDEQSEGDVNHSTYESEKYFVLTIRKRIGSDKYEIEKE